ncbi:MAG: hypothetical protein WCK77_02480 [Verrucomicrobiota bacterium]
MKLHDIKTGTPVRADLRVVLALVPGKWLPQTSGQRALNPANRHTFFEYGKV